MAAKVDRLARMREMTKKVEAAPAKKSGMREVLVPDDVRARVVALCEIASIHDDIKPQYEQHKSVVQEDLFNIWSQEMWDQKHKPENFRVVNRQNNMVDSQCNFVVKFRKDGIRKKFDGELPENKTLVDVITEQLLSLGLVPEKARSFLNNEIEICEKFDLVKSLNEMVEEEKGSVLNSIGNKLLIYFQSRSTRKNGKVEVAEVTDEEEQSVLKLKTYVTLKEDIEARIWNYVTSLEQLRNLIRFCGASLVISNFDFGVSDDASTKANRMEMIAAKYLNPHADNDDNDD